MIGTVSKVASITSIKDQIASWSMDSPASDAVLTCSLDEIHPISLSNDKIISCLLL